VKARHNGKMRDYYRILDPKLGTGAYGEVRKCVYKDNIKDKKSSIKEYRAVKILSKAYMEEKDVRGFQNEIFVMTKLHHPNILKFHHFFEDLRRYLMVMDICEGGELFDYTKSEESKGGFNSFDAGFIMK